MTNNSGLDGQSRSRRKARPIVLGIVALGVLIAIIAAIAKPRETREGAVPAVAPDAAVGADTSTRTPSPPPVPETVSPGGEGTREMPDGGPPLDSTAPPR